MPFETKSVPFEIPTVNQGFRVAKGLVNVDGESLAFEFEVTDAFIGILTSDVQEVRLPLSELQSVEFKKGWFGSKVVIEAQSIKTLKDIPGTEMTECVLKIKRKDRREAENLVSKARLIMSEMKLNDLDKEI